MGKTAIVTGAGLDLAQASRQPLPKKAQKSWWLISMVMERKL